MTGELISIEELSAIREIGESGMTTPVEIYRERIVGPDDLEYDPYTDLGDDEWDPYHSEGAYTGSAYGWFFSHLQQDVTEDSAQITTIDIHELHLPWGTDIKPHDSVKRVDTSEVYEVIDTNADDTHAEQLTAMLRRRE